MNIWYLVPILNIWYLEYLVSGSPYEYLVSGTCRKERALLANAARAWEKIISAVKIKFQGKI